MATFIACRFERFLFPPRIIRVQRNPPRTKSSKGGRKRKISQETDSNRLVFRSRSDETIVWAKCHCGNLGTREQEFRKKGQSKLRRHFARGTPHTRNTQDQILLCRASPCAWNGPATHLRRPGIKLRGDRDARERACSTYLGALQCPTNGPRETNLTHECTPPHHQAFRSNIPLQTRDTVGALDTVAPWQTIFLQ